MSYLYLSLALLLPWLNGYLWLSYFESFFTGFATANRIRIAGYGFFFGYAILSFIIVLNSGISGKVSFLVVMSVLSLLTAAGAVLLRRKVRSAKNRQARAASSLSLKKFGPVEWAVLLLAIWALIHLSFSLLEILSRPVYPWDAWLMWIYRAKAWFTLGTVFDFQNTVDWLATSAPAFTVNAIDYPMFASVIPFWAAIGLGYWSETLVNLPVILCGIAIALALYGQCREYGLSVSLTLVFCYLLFSTPFFGTHLALAGYADIWMSGFAGLGFVALIHGGISSRLKQSLFGLAMIALSVLVKNEGSVWLLGAATFFLILHVPRKPLLTTVAAGTVLVLLALKFGVDPITIPLLGDVSVIDKRITLPFVGTFTLQVFNVWKQYLFSFFLTGSWNLIWILPLACLLIFAAKAKERSSTVVATFIFVFLATQALIFVFSSHGEFAIRYTAINRLPLQFLPAILFSAAVMAQKLLNPKEASSSDPATGASHAA